MLVYEERKRVDFEADGISDMMRALLGSRGITSEKEANDFLCPSISQLCDPLSIHGMKDAVDRIARALSSGERIMVYGDYDVDGVTATAALLSYFKSAGACVDYYIPSRHEEGYGLNSDAVRRIAGIADLCITVDCGITSVAEAELAKTLGLSLIITDHHKPGPELPECEALVSAVLGGQYDKYAGVGIAAMLVFAIGGMKALWNIIDLAALGTVADIVPLTGDNRILTAIGLIRMNESTRLGIAALMSVMKSYEKEITASHIAYFISPRINAGGRMGRSNRSVELLLTDDEQVAAEIAESLNNENTIRQEVEARIIQEVEEQIREKVDFIRDRVIILKGRWNQGVVGLVASRIVERYHFPVILLCESGSDDDDFAEGSDIADGSDAAGDSDANFDNILTGSARSIPGINLHAALEPFSHMFIRFGGHEQAAGITMEKKNFERFSSEFNQALRYSVPPETYIPRSVYDLTISLGRLSPRFVNDLKSLQPTGFGNPAPIFRAEPVDIINPRKVGAQQLHVKMSLADGDTLVDAIAFKMGHMMERMNGPMDVLFSPAINVWNGRAAVQCEVRAIRASRDIAGFVEECAAEADEKFMENIRERIGRVSGEHEGITVITSEKDADKAINRAIETIQGTLLIAYTPKAVEDIADRKCGEYIVLNSGHIEQDIRAFTTLCFAPRWRVDETEYHQVICLDGDWGEIPLIASIYPKARISVISTQRSLSYARPWARRLLPTKDSLRSLYLAVRKAASARGPGQAARLRNTAELIRKYAKYTEKDALQLISSLCILSELELIVYKNQDAGIELLPQSRKCDPSESAFYMTLASLASG